MTNKTPPQMAVTVEQADREAATSLAEWLSAAQKEWEGMVVWFDDDAPREFRSGKHDDHEFVQAFASHRLAQQSAATGGEVPSGFVVVPCEVTNEMVNAGVKAWLGLYEGRAPEWTDYLTRTWRAMLAAAPKPTHPNDMARENADFIRAARDFANAGPDKFKPGYGQYVDLLQAAESLLSTTPSNPPAPSDGVLREQVARIIHPTAFQLADELSRPGSEGFQDYRDARTKADEQTAVALAKADAILALTNPAGEGGVRARALEEALKAELADLNEDIWWAEGSDMARFIARRERMEAAISTGETK